LIALRKMARRDEFAGSEAQALLQALVELVSREEALTHSSHRQTKLHDYFSAVGEENYHQVQQPQPGSSPTRTPTAELSPTSSCNSPTVQREDADIPTQTQTQVSVEERKEAVQEASPSTINSEDEPPQATNATPTQTQTEPQTPSKWQQRVQRELEKSGQTPWQARKTPKRGPPTPTLNTTPSPNAKEARQGPAPHTPPPVREPEKPQINMARVKLAAALATAASPTREHHTDSEEDEGYETPEDWIEPERDPKCGYGTYLDRKHEYKVREQNYAIRKSLPRYIASELGRPFNKADENRLLTHYRNHLTQVSIERGTTQFNYDCFLRLLAEEQVRWQGKPEDALKMLKARAMDSRQGTHPRLVGEEEDQTAWRRTFVIQQPKF